MKIVSLVSLLFVVILGVVLVFPVFGAPPGAPNYASCMDRRCDPSTGPVCAIDSTGHMRTFESRCWAEFAYCREGRYYAIMKNGEC